MNEPWSVFKKNVLSSHLDVSAKAFIQLEDVPWIGKYPGNHVEISREFKTLQNESLYNSVHAIQFVVPDCMQWAILAK